MDGPSVGVASNWPPLPLAAWKPTCETIHRWTQVAGTIRLACAPPQNHWWQVAFRLTPRGLTTTPIPYGDLTFEIAFDFVGHDLSVITSDGRMKQFPLMSRTVADFYAELMQVLAWLGIEVHIWTEPVEIPGELAHFDEDEDHGEYDPLWATRWFRVLQQADLTLERFASRFQGKQSPVHFFWGSFDLAYTRFSGRRAPPRPGADRITREAYSHEVASFGFWPGAEGVSDAAFSAYGAPEPEGLRSAGIGPPARYSEKLGEFLLPYEDVRRSRDAQGIVLAFFQRAYDSIAALGNWDRAALDRPAEVYPGVAAEEHQPEQPAP